MGFRAGPLIVAGHAVLELALLAALLAGLGPVLTLEAVRTSLALAGGTTLVAMGWAALRSASRARPLSELAGGAGRSMHPFVAGVVLSVSNPYWILWWATVGLAFLAPAAAGGRARWRRFTPATSAPTWRGTAWWPPALPVADGGCRSGSGGASWLYAPWR